MVDFMKFIEKIDEELRLRNENIESSGWNIVEKRFVAFMDIAGFKATNQFEYYSFNLVHALKNISKEEQNNYVDDVNEYLYIVSVSDSVVVFSKDDSIESFCCFCHAVGRIFNKCVLLGRFMTVAMSCGMTYVDKEKMIFGGIAYDEAYQLQEQMDYYGILGAPSIIDFFIKNSNCTDTDYLRYKKHFYDVEYYMKTNSRKDSSVKREKGLNYFWYDKFLYDYVVYSKITWGRDNIGLCSDEVSGIVVCNYKLHIAYKIENYDEPDERIKERMMNTINVLESMLSQHSFNHKMKFSRKKYQ
jgi:hypothetical protein